MDCIVHVVAKSRTGLSDFQFHFQSKKQITSRKRKSKDNEYIHCGILSQKVFSSTIIIIILI